MKKNEENRLLSIACHKLFSSNIQDEFKLLHWLNQQPSNISIESINQYQLLLFSYPIILLEDGITSDKIERIIALIFDKDEIIADSNVLHFKAKDSLINQDILDYLSIDDWTYFQTIVLREALQKEGTQNGNALLISNLYVSKAYRNQGLMKVMLETIREHSLRNTTSNTELHIIFSLDPDIPCYGPDSSDKPYYYSMEKDEPIRLQNQEILKHLGFNIIRLTNDYDSTTNDGTKTYFAYRHELIIIETTQGIA